MELDPKNSNTNGIHNKIKYPGSSYWCIQSYLVSCLVVKALNNICNTKQLFWLLVCVVFRRELLLCMKNTEY
jgi:hypothetical protein